MLPTVRNLLAARRHLQRAIACATLVTVVNCQPQAGEACHADTPFKLLDLSPEASVDGWRLGDRLLFRVSEGLYVGSAVVSTDLCGGDMELLAEDVTAMRTFDEEVFLACDPLGTVTRFDPADPQKTRDLATNTNCEFGFVTDRLTVLWDDSGEGELLTSVVFDDVLADEPVPVADRLPPLRYPSVLSNTVYGIDASSRLLEIDASTGSTEVIAEGPVVDFQSYLAGRFALEVCTSSACDDTLLWLRDDNHGMLLPLPGASLPTSFFEWSPNGRYVKHSNYAGSVLVEELFDTVTHAAVDLPPHEDVFLFFEDSRLWLRDTFLGHVREFVWDPSNGSRTDLLIVNDRYSYYSPRFVADHLEVIFGEEYGLLSGSLWRIDLDGSEPVEIAAEVGRGYTYVADNQIATVLNQRFDDFDDLYSSLLGDLFLLDLDTGGGTFVDTDVLPLMKWWQVTILPDTLIYQVSDLEGDRSGLWAVSLPQSGISSR